MSEGKQKSFRRTHKKKKRWQNVAIVIAILLVLGLIPSCHGQEEDRASVDETQQAAEETQEAAKEKKSDKSEKQSGDAEAEEEPEDETAEEPEEAAEEPVEAAAEEQIDEEPAAQEVEEPAPEAVEESAAPGTPFDLAAIPAYDGSTPYAVVNDNNPYFTDEEMTADSFEFYSDLDGLGRCGPATASIGQDLMPTEERGDISSVHPTGWHSTNYDIVSGESLYNRCHLIAFELAGENANEKNLITGTRYFNVDGMLPFENMVADYVKETGNHVMYRVTPVFEGDNLVADGVLMEAKSVEDQGEGILYCVFCYNVQPGISIDYATGDSWEDGAAQAEVAEAETAETETASAGDASAEEATYILNNNTMKFHRPSCSSVNQMSDANKQEYTGSRDLLIEQGYSPCGNCNP